MQYPKQKQTQTQRNIITVDEFRAITISFDKNKLPDGFDKEADCILAENESGEEEIVFGINGKRVKGLEGDCIRAYFLSADIQQSARKHLEEYAKENGIARVIYEKLQTANFKTRFIL